MKIGFSAISDSSYNLIPDIQKQLIQGVHEAGETPIICRQVQDTIGLDSFVLVNSLSLNTQKEIFDNVQQYWTYLLDAPFHHAGWISFGPPSVNYAVVDPSHVDMLSQLNRNGVFFPHGGDTHAFRSWKDRDIEILLTGTAPDLDKIPPLIESLSPELQDMAKFLIQEASGFSEQGLFEQLIAFLKHRGRNISVVDSMSLLKVVDHVVRGMHRRNFLDAFSEFSVVVAGGGWDHIELSPKHHWIGEVPYQNVAELMSRAKIVLCPSCGFTQGAHDRILTAMGCGAVPLTMPTSYLSQHFQHGIHLAYFKELKEAVDLGRLILNGPHWEVVGEAGHAAVASGHSWIHRGKELVSMLRANTAIQSLGARTLPPIIAAVL